MSHSGNSESHKKSLTHLDSQGQVRMVDVSSKPVMLRKATARGVIKMSPRTVEMVCGGVVPKGNVLETARIAAIQAAKRTGDWIPLCHPLPIQGCDVHFSPDRDRGSIAIEATAIIQARTGVEMEALTAVSAAALTIYDMCKAVDKDMEIGEIRLTSKTKTPV